MCQQRLTVVVTPLLVNGSERQRAAVSAWEPERRNGPGTKTSERCYNQEGVHGTMKHVPQIPKMTVKE